MIELLVQIPGSVPQQTLDDALLMAIKNDQPAIMDILLNAGANPNAKDKTGTTSLTLMTSSKNGVGLEILLNHGANVNDTKALQNAVKVGNSEAVEILLKHGAKVDCRNSQGATALITAASHTQCMETICGLLLENGATVNAQDEQLNTALHYAVMKLRGVETLVTHGARADIPNMDGNTALMHAASEGLCSIIKILMRSGSDVNVKNSVGKTALHVLAMKGHGCCISELIRQGGDVTIRDNEGKTPLDNALERQQVNAARILLQHNSEVLDEITITELLLEGRYSLVKILVIAGVTTREIEQILTSYRHDVKTEMVTWLNDVTNKPRTLLELSRFKIRGLLGPKRFSDKCECLPLPRYLKDILLMIDLDHH